MPRGASSTAPPTEAVGRAGTGLLASRRRGAGLDRCPDRPAQPALLRRVRRPPRPAPARRRRGRRPDGRHRPVQGPQRPSRPRDRRRGAEGGGRGDRRRPSARTTSRPGSAARSSSSCCATRSRASRSRSASGSAPAVAALDLARLGVDRRERVGRRGGRRRRPTQPIAELIDDRRSRALSSQARAAATGSSPRSGSDRVRLATYHRALPRRVARTDPHAAVTAEADLPDDPDAHRGRRRCPGEPRQLTNGDLARIFHDIGDMLEVKGELVFKTVAYHRAADAIGRSPVDLVAAYRAGRSAADPGCRRRDQRQDRRARDDRADGVLRQAPRRGPAEPRRAAAHPGSRAEDRPPDLDRARRSSRSTTCDGPPRPARCARCAASRRETEQLVLEGIARLESAPRPDAPAPGRGASSTASSTALGRRRRARRRIEPAGSFRRRARIDRRPRPPGRDRRRPGPDRAVHALGVVDQVLNQGGYKAAVRLLRGPQVDLMVMPPGEAGTYRIHFTGLQGAQRPPARAGPRPGLEPVGEGLPAHRRGRRAADRRRRRAAHVRDRGARRTRFLGLPFIEPELRENEGEIEAALAGTPAAAHRARRPARRPAQPLRLVRRHPLDRGHGRGRPAARPRLPGPDRPHAVAGHRPRPDARPRRGAARRSSPTSTPGSPARRTTGRPRPRRRPRASACCTAASSRSAPTAPSTTRTPCSARFDLVVASVHVSRRQSRAELTQRTLNGIRSPHVDVIAHPVGPDDRRRATTSTSTGTWSTPRRRGPAPCSR